MCCLSCRSIVSYKQMVLVALRSGGGSFRMQGSGCAGSATVVRPTWILRCKVLLSFQVQMKFGGGGV